MVHDVDRLRAELAKVTDPRNPPVSVCGVGSADPALEVWTNASVAAQLDGLGGRVHVVGHGDAVSVAGIDATVHGELHAEIHPENPRIPNIGFLVAGRVFHPGDALTILEEPVATLLLPMHARGRGRRTSSTTCGRCTRTRRSACTTAC